MKKGVDVSLVAFIAVSIFFLVAIFSTAVSADTTVSDNVSSKGYACLERITNNSNPTLQEAVFTVLALGNKNIPVNKINSSQKAGEACWPKEACTIKDTAQVLLAYKRIGLNTSSIESWLLSRNASLSELSWFLEIDLSNHVSGQCNIKYDGATKSINVGSDMKLSGDPGSCLSITPSGYWLKIDSNCLNKQFSVSCNQDFITTLLYQKSSGSTVYVSSNTQSSIASGNLTEEIRAKCLKTGSLCDYEGTLWAALALHKTDINVNIFMPYLVALAADNPTVFPSALIYSTVGGEDQFNDILQTQKSDNSWEASSTKYNRYYDTSLAMMSLSGSGVPAYDNGRTFLYQTQQSGGCWNNDNVRDTAFILYSIWPKELTPATPDTSGDDFTEIDEPTTTPCEPTHYCTRSDVCVDSNGLNLGGDYECTSATDICCSIDAQLPTCSEQSGIICSANKECPEGSSIDASDSGICCSEACVDAVTPEETPNTCEPAEDTANGACKETCDSGEEPSADFECGDTGLSCCVASAAPSKISWTLIIIIAAVIVLIIILILLRDKIRLSLFKFSGKASSSTMRRPGMPPESPFRPAPPAKPFSFFGRSSPPPQPQPMRRPMPAPQKEREMEDTLKKLKEMSR